METTKLSSKGQVILPKAVRDARHWRAGTEFIVEANGDGVLLRPLKALAPRTLATLAGCLGGPARRTIEDMQSAIAEELKARHGRGRY
jgi:AbrB family looped-hinge helix DNA binding protein